MIREEEMQDNKKLTVMVSSTVYGIEELLDRVYTLLTAFGYEVWMSHKGTVPVFSNRSAFENCIAATENCDLFLGLITPHYGSGRDRTCWQSFRQVSDRRCGVPSHTLSRSFRRLRTSAFRSAFRPL